MKTKFTYWVSTIAYSIVLFISNFGETQILTLMPRGFSFWFVILVFAGCFGFIISYLVGLKKSLWTVGIAFLVISFTSILLGLIKPSIFGIVQLNIAVLFLQVLKIALASVFGILGLMLWQNTNLSQELIKAHEKLNFYEKNLLDAKREAELLKKEAEIKAEEVLLDAKKKIQELERLKRDLEIKIREFLQIELSVLEKHEDTLKD